MSDLTQRLRAATFDVRRQKMPIGDLIPMMQEDADRIEADEALMPMLLDALESCDPGDFSTGHVIHASYNETLVEAAITALRKLLESSK